MKTSIQANIQQLDKLLEVFEKENKSEKIKQFRDDIANLKTRETKYLQAAKNDKKTQKEALIKSIKIVETLIKTATLLQTWEKNLEDLFSSIDKIITENTTRYETLKTDSPLVDTAEVAGFLTRYNDAINDIKNIKNILVSNISAAKLSYCGIPLLKQQTNLLTKAQKDFTTAHEDLISREKNLNIALETAKNLRSSILEKANAELENAKTQAKATLEKLKASPSYFYTKKSYNLTEANLLSARYFLQLSQQALAEIPKAIAVDYNQDCDTFQKAVDAKKELLLNDIQKALSPLKVHIKKYHSAFIKKQKNLIEILGTLKKDKKKVLAQVSQLSIPEDLQEKLFALNIDEINPDTILNTESIIDLDFKAQEAIDKKIETLKTISIFCKKEMVNRTSKFNDSAADAIRSMIEEITRELKKFKSKPDDPRYLLLLNIQKELNLQVQDYVNLKTDKHQFIINTKEAISRHLNTAQLSILSKPELTEFERFLRTLLKPLDILIKTVKGKPFNPRFFAKETEKTLLETVNTTYATLDKIVYTLENDKRIDLTSSPP